MTDEVKERKRIKSGKIAKIYKDDGNKFYYKSALFDRVYSCKRVCKDIFLADVAGGIEKSAPFVLGELDDNIMAVISEYLDTWADQLHEVDYMNQTHIHTIYPHHILAEADINIIETYLDKCVDRTTTTTKAYIDMLYILIEGTLFIPSLTKKIYAFVCCLVLLCVPELDISENIAVNTEYIPNI